MLFERQKSVKSSRIMLLIVDCQMVEWVVRKKSGFEGFEEGITDLVNFRSPW